jgi:hypothetical protein
MADTQAADPKDAPIGTGMAKRASNALALRKEYLQHIEDAQTNGETPMKYEDWVAKRVADQQAGYDSAK